MRSDEEAADPLGALVWQHPRLVAHRLGLLNQGSDKVFNLAASGQHTQH